MTGRCRDCRFWEEAHDAIGFCRVHPPRFGGEVGWDDETTASMGVWPETDATDWCGAHQPREAADGDSR